MSEFPKLKWVDVDGRQVPFTYPQHEKEDGSFENTGENNNLPTYDKRVEQAVKDVQDALGDTPSDYPDSAVKAELESIKETQSQILQRLDGTFNAQVTGSIVGDGTVHSSETLMRRRVLNERYELINIDVPNGVSSGIIYLVIFGVTGEFGSNQGARMQVRPSRSPLSNRPPIGVFTDYSTTRNSVLAVAIGKGFTLADSTPQSTGYDYKVVGTPIGSRLGFGIAIDGDFENDEGVDCQVEVEWFN